jgi:hypothetical protein
MAMSREDDFDAKQDLALQGIYWRDEILQLMSWLKGEGILPDVVSDAFQRFLEADRGRVGERLAPLVQDGYLEPAPGNGARYRLSTLVRDSLWPRLVPRLTGAPPRPPARG